MEASGEPSRGKLRLRVAFSALQVSATLGLLAWAYDRIDLALLARDKLSFVWLSLALACTVPAFAAAAWRWSFTAQRLGVPLGFRRALPEVYLASFLNSLLPTGVAGDVLRAARQGVFTRTSRRHDARAWLSVVLERLSGQLLLWFVLLLSLARWPLFAELGLLRWLPLALLFALLIAALWLRALQSSVVATNGLAMDVRRSLFADGALAVQFAASLLVLAACTLGFACSAKGLSVPLSFADLVRIVPPMLALSALPLSIGGFGVREAASAALYAGSGLDAATGIAVASVFGLANLLGSAPGALFVWLSPGPRHER